MAKPVRFAPAEHAVSMNRRLQASLVAEQPDPPVRVDGVTFGVATMTANAPHGGERHPDGDEILYLIAGRARVVLLNDEAEDIDLQPGDGLIVPKGVWHRVDILEPCEIVYVTPGPNNEFRPLDDS